MRPNGNRSAIGFAAAFAQVADQLFAGIQLSLCRLTAIEIADKADSERDIVQKIAMNMTTIDLAAPPIAYFHLAVAG